MSGCSWRPASVRSVGHSPPMAAWASKTLTRNAPAGALWRSVLAATRPDGPAPGRRQRARASRGPRHTPGGRLLTHRRCTPTWPWRWRSWWWPGSMLAAARRRLLAAARSCLQSGAARGRRRADGLAGSRRVNAGAPALEQSAARGGRSGIGGASLCLQQPCLVHIVGVVVSREQAVGAYISWLYGHFSTRILSLTLLASTLVATRIRSYSATRILVLLAPSIATRIFTRIFHRSNRTHVRTRTASGSRRTQAAVAYHQLSSRTRADVPKTAEKCPNHLPPPSLALVPGRHLPFRRRRRGTNTRSRRAWLRGPVVVPQAAHALRLPLCKLAKAPPGVPRQRRCRARASGSTYSSPG